MINTNVTPITEKQPTPTAKFTITASIDGFPVQIEGEGPAACERCGETFPDSALDSDGLCAECCFERHLEAKRRREEYFGLADDNPEIYDYSDADPGCEQSERTMKR